MKVDWTWNQFEELTGREVYEILALRQRIFVVEQACAYLDADGFDADSLHLIGRDHEGTLVAYLRLLPPGVRFPEPSIGRVITAREIRHSGTGRALMKEGIRKAAEVFPGVPVLVSAQCYLRGFYQSLGFVPRGALYDEDGISHISMLRFPP